MSVLEQIIANKRLEVAARRRERPLEALRTEARSRSPAPDFRAALTAGPMGLIAEVKRRSPSAGPIREPFDPIEVARAYERAGASAISVLMDERYFGGGEADFSAVRNAVSLPLLYKEFVVHPWQVWHAAALGASAVLLIVAAVPPVLLLTLQETCRTAGLRALVEVHNADELLVAAAAGAGIIGVNNRDLRTFRTEIATSLSLAGKAPPGAVLVSESGIRGSEDVRTLRDAGYRAVLVGEHLLRQADPGAAARALLNPHA